MAPKIFFNFYSDLFYLAQPSNLSMFKPGEHFRRSPSFEPGTRIQDSSGDIGASPMVIYSAPKVADLDGDGLKDLIIGQKDGMIYFYANSGTNADPSFTTKLNLKTNVSAL